MHQLPSLPQSCKLRFQFVLFLVHPRPQKDPKSHDFGPWSLDALRHQQLAASRRLRTGYRWDEELCLSVMGRHSTTRKKAAMLMELVTSIMNEKAIMITVLPKLTIATVRMVPEMVVLALLVLLLLLLLFVRRLRCSSRGDTLRKVSVSK